MRLLLLICLKSVMKFVICFAPQRSEWEKKVYLLEVKYHLFPVSVFCDQDKEKSANQNPNTGRVVVTPKGFCPGMAVIQIGGGSRDNWHHVPRLTVLGEHGSRMLVIRADAQGCPVVGEERRSELVAPLWALQESFPDQIP